MCILELDGSLDLILLVTPQRFLTTRLGSPVFVFYLESENTPQALEYDLSVDFGLI